MNLKIFLFSMHILRRERNINFKNTLKNWFIRERDL